MTRHYIIIGVVSLVFLSAIIAGFMVAGTPWDVRAQKFDQTRLSNFSQIRSAIQSYYSKNKSLPSKLSDLPTDYYYSDKIKDPETNKDYDYQVVSNTSYKLCATFSADSSAANPNQNNLLYDYSGLSNATTTHIKGYDCITYNLPDYYTSLGNSNYGQVVITNPAPFPTLSTSSVIATRDARRIADLKQVQTALELYYAKNGAYPTTGVVSWANLQSTLVSGGLGISMVPDDPNALSNWHYIYVSNGQSYVLAAHLEDQNNQALKTDLDGTVLGLNCADPLYCIQL